MTQLMDNLKGRAYWQGLEQLAGSPEVDRALAQEFPGYSPEHFTGTRGETPGGGAGGGGFSRRGFMKLMGASMALAGVTLTGCRRWPKEEIRPFAYRPEGYVPGEAVMYATQFDLGGVATGILAKSYDGRPIKIEGNPQHPFSRGASDAFAQASVLTLYDPDRSRYPVESVAGGTRSRRTWDDFTRFAQAHFAKFKSNGGAGLAVLAEPVSGPSFARMRAAFRKAYPKAVWVQYQPLTDATEGSTRLAWGQALRPQFDLTKARVIVTFDADLLGAHPAHLKHAGDWATTRRSADHDGHRVMSRMFAIEGNFTITGSVADHRLPLRPSRIPLVLQAVAAGVGVGGVTIPEGLTDNERAFADLIVSDLNKPENRGASVVAGGGSLSQQALTLVHAINARLGNVGATLTYIAQPDADVPHGLEALSTLAADAGAGHIDTLVILGGNPVFDAPADLDFATLVRDKIPTSIHLSLYADETSQRATWHLNQAHYLECWGDGAAWDGTVGVQQPLILPLFDGRSAIELLALLTGDATTSGASGVSGGGQDLVKATFGHYLVDEDFDKAWTKLLHDGVLPGSAKHPVSVGEPTIATAPALGASGASGTSGASGGGLDVQFVPDNKLHDGRFANNGWLQELPDPLTKVTWDNPALISLATAKKLGLDTNDVVTLTTSSGAKLEIAVYVTPGLAEDTLILAVGQGRKSAGHVGNGVGFDTYTLRTTKALTLTRGQVQPTGRTYKLASTQVHHLIDAVGMWGREQRVGPEGQSGSIVREATLAQYRDDARVFQGRGGHGEGVALQLFEPPAAFNEPHAWGMAIDLSACIGCSACVVACQAENNIPIVGKTEVLNHREMHWLRIDRYFKGEVASPDVVHMPLMCVHCENAPCEQVCPVAATTHDSEGLNVMVYNRCIGTRYCSNNCPYKIRHFNYFDFHSKDPHAHWTPWLDIPDTQQQAQVDQIKRMVFNPSVTVRMRGVMEKCTYCTQRIQEQRINAKVAFANGQRTSDLVDDGAILTACQQACPTQAIVFGNLNDQASKVVKLHQNHRAYGVLDGELNVRPRTKHLAIVRNPVTA
jgi:molybdopterin-containing oxidoreductase family iron-sulfur binding subunit